MDRPLLNTNKKLNVLCVSGTRADYGIYRPFLFELEQDTRFNLQLVITGMHLLREYGSTINEVKKDPFTICATPSILLRGDSTLEMSQSVGLAILHFSEIFQLHQPDFILLLGDRGEMLAAAIAAHYQNIGIIHLHGGEQSGSADDSVRHAISKFAHLHFVSTFKSKDNLRNMGEEGWRIFPVGSLRKSEIRGVVNQSKEDQVKLEKKYNLDTEKVRVLLVIHPDSKERLSFNGQIEEVIKGIKNIQNACFIIIGSNSDAGGNIFRQALLNFSENHPFTQYFSSIPSSEYLFLLSQVDVLIGNSSSGIIESPFFGTPTINVGFRQRNREQGSNVMNTGYQSDEIKNAIELARETRSPISNPYDLVDIPEKEMIKILKEMCHHPKLLLKELCSLV